MRPATVHSLSAILTFFLCTFFSIFLVQPSSAQGFGTYGGATINGVPPSVTSFGFGGHPGFHGVPASVTSLNFGNAPLHINSGHAGHFGIGNRHRNSGFVNPIYGPSFMPYAYPWYAADTGIDDTMEEGSYDSGAVMADRPPTVIREYVERVPDRDYRSELNRPSRQAVDQLAPEQPVEDQPPTVLVFKDGHQQEVANYAIIGVTLYDLTGGRTKKVALAELDLPATVKQNDDRGVDFRLPAANQAN